MSENKKEYLGMLCNLYVIFLLAVLPLYMRQGYWRLGDDKYLLFRNVTLLCMICSAIFLVAAGIQKLWNRTIAWSWVDSFVLGYGICNVLSWFFSDYRSTAWLGYRDWYMGLLSQLLFVWIYFFVSRCYEGAAYPVRSGQGALFAVIIIGIANRLSMDVLGVFRDGERGAWNRGDWDYTHLLSTVGNINWLCGYLAVLLPFALVGYLRAKEKWLAVWLYFVSASGLLFLWIQGSDSGVGLSVLIPIVLLLFGVCRKQYRKRIWLLGIGELVLCRVFLALLGLVRRESTIPTDDKGIAVLQEVTSLSLLVWMILVFAVVYVCRLSKGKKLTAVCVITLAVIGAENVLDAKTLFGEAAWTEDSRIEQDIENQFFGTIFSEMILSNYEADGAENAAGGENGFYGWGSGRGGLWTLAVDGFRQGDWKQKLIGAGPDCYGEYVYDKLPADNYIVVRGQWQDAVFANAHNEWLNQLVNIGIMGTVAYLGIFVAGFFRYGKRCLKDSYYLLGVMALLLYGANSLISFQQVMNAPYLFLILGLCENRAIYLTGKE